MTLYLFLIFLGFLQSLYTFSLLLVDTPLLYINKQGVLPHG